MTYPEFITGRYVGKTVHVVGSGPSLLGFDFSRLTGKVIIAINHAYKQVPQFDVKVAIDANFYTREDKEAIHHGCTLAPAHACREPHVINFRMASHFIDQPGPVYAYGSSGLAAVTVALQGGAERVVLWGLDYCFIDGVHHSTQGIYNHTMKEGREHIYGAQVSKFAVFPADKILNASAQSALPYFRKVSVDEALKN